MDKVEAKIITDKSIWENFLQKHFEVNFLQSWLWGEFQESLDRKVFRTGLYKNGDLKGVFLAYIETSKRGKFLVVPGGPILDWNDEEIVSEFVNSSRQISAENNCIFVRVRPQLTDSEYSRKIFSKAGFKDAPMYLHAELTSQLNIEKSEDELMSQMRKSTRYELKKAISSGIKIDLNGEENIQSFYDLQIETSKRQKFVPFSKNFLMKQFDLFIKADKAILYTASFEDKILAQAFIIFYGKEAVYHYGASTDEGRKYPGAYLIQWEAIKEAKKRGQARYNFWGVAPEGDQNHRFSGLSLFKRGFGGEDVKYLQAQDLVVDKKRYAVDFWIEKIRRKIRHS